MEELRSTRHWGKKPHGSAYDNDFFGGLTRHMTPFSARFEDYCEIFGGEASASSIPVLDLPLADDDFVAADDIDHRLGLDYSEIFGRLSDCAFLVSYEDLFGCSRGSQASSLLDGRARYGVLFEQQAKEALEHSLEGYSEERLGNLEMDEISLVPQPLDDVNSNQISISKHKTRWGIIDDSISEKINAIKEFVSPELTVVVDARARVFEMKDQQVNKEITNHTGTKMYIDGGQYNEAQSNSSFNAATSENFKEDHKPSKSNCDSLLNAPENEKNLSRSSSYHSASSGDISLSDVEYLNISEIRLKTKPFHGPPPVRPPPQLIKKPEHPTMLNMDSRSDLEERSLLEPKMKCHIQRMEDDSSYYDNEMDPSSGAIASVVAVKAAMEKAQARLKIAKEMMDKKRDKFKRKVDQPKATNCEKDGADYEVALKTYSKVVTSNDFLKGNNSVHEYTYLGREETSNAGTRSLNHEKKGLFPSTSGETQQQVSPGNGFGSVEATCEFDELYGEWKTEKKYYKLIRNGSLLNKVKDNYMHDNEKKEKTTIYGTQVIYKDNKKGDQAFEVLENQKLSEPSDSVEKLENDYNLNNSYVDSYKNVANEIMEDSVLTEGIRKHEAYGCHILDETQKEADVHHDNTTGDDHNPPNSAMDSCLCQDSENMLQALSSSFEPGADNNFCDELVSNAAETTFINMENRREFKVANEAKFQGRFGEKIEVSNDLCSNKTSDKMKVAKETKMFYENVMETKNRKYLYVSHVSACRAEQTNNAVEENVADGLQTNGEASILRKNELENETICNDSGLEIRKERRDASIQLHEDESMGRDRNHGLHYFEFLGAAERDCVEKGNENTLEVPVACIMGENEILSNLAKEVCPQCAESDAMEIIFSRKEDNSPTKAPETTEVYHTEEAEDHKHSFQTEEENNLAEREKERDREQGISLEEKEREREREKDRIAVERANLDAHQRALAEARERAERFAVERVTAVARQRALSEAREKAEKVAEAEKASREAKLRAERAAVERATEEARQRAIEKALAEKASIEARTRMRKGNAATHFKDAHVKEDSETRLKSSSNAQSRSAACSIIGQRYSDSCDNGGSESKLRCKARQERQQRTAERAEKALAEKNMRDILAQREQAERDRLAESMDAEVRRWSSGKEGNLRALLSTLQYILGSDSGWQPVPLTDVLTAVAVKKAYRKATLCVHPDKLQQRGATIQQKYICEKIFDLLKEAWNKFNSEER